MAYYDERDEEGEYIIDTQNYITEEDDEEYPQREKEILYSAVYDSKTLRKNKTKLPSKSHEMPKRNRDGVNEEEMWSFVSTAAKDDHNEEENDVDREKNDSPFQSKNNSNKKKIKNGRTDEEICFDVERFLAKLEIAAEEDAQLNRKGEPAVNKLMLLPQLTQVVKQTRLQREFLDRGILTVLKNWLEPLPDKSFPNLNLRTEILRILAEVLPINIEEHERLQQLKLSGLGRVVHFLSTWNEETPSNKRLAKTLVEKWSRCLFGKSDSYQDLRRMQLSLESQRAETLRMASRSSSSAKRPLRAVLESDDFDLDRILQHRHMTKKEEEEEEEEEQKKRRIDIPGKIAMDFVVRPPSKIDTDDFVHHQNNRGEERWNKLAKKLAKRRPKKQVRAGFRIM